MTSRGWRRSVGAFALTAVLVLAGCGDGGSDGGGSSDHGPLAAFFGWDDVGLSGDYEFTEEDRQRHYQVQEYIVTCMAELGFEYYPEPFWGDQEGHGRIADDPYQEAWALQQEDPEAFAKQYGYAITTIEYDFGDDGFDEWDPSDDPNWAYRESLSPAAQQEYERALWGEWPEEWDDGEPMEIDMSVIGGCQNVAYDQAYGMGEDWEEEQARFETLWQEWETLYQRIENDPRLSEVMQGWRSCMADAGHPGLTERWDGQELVHERQREVYRWDVYEEPPHFDDPEEEREYWESFEPYEPAADEVAELRAYELEVAWDDYTCRQEFDLEAVEREVRFELEEEFIEDHRPLLEEYRDFLNERGMG